MSTELIGFIVGTLFGAGLLLGGLADPDKIVGTLRLKDFHALRTIAVFILVSMLGVWILEMTGTVNYSVKPAAIVANLIGGAIIGIGFGLTGYCPGTGLACAAAGRIDAMITVLGMFVGALFFILIYPSIVVPIDNVANYKKVTLPEITEVSRGIWVLAIVVAGTAALILTRPKKVN